MFGFRVVTYNVNLTHMLSLELNLILIFCGGDYPIHRICNIRLSFVQDFIWFYTWIVICFRFYFKFSRIHIKGQSEWSVFDVWWKSELGRKLFEYLTVNDYNANNYYTVNYLRSLGICSSNGLNLCFSLNGKTMLLIIPPDLTVYRKTNYNFSIVVPHRRLLHFHRQEAKWKIKYVYSSLQTV